MVNHPGAGPDSAHVDPKAMESGVSAGIAVLAFILEVAMLAALLFWGFKQPSPWNLILGLGVPAVVVVFWAAFMAPRSERRLPAHLVERVSFALFLLSAGALFSVGSWLLGALMALASLVQFVASRSLSR